MGRRKISLAEKRQRRLFGELLKQQRERQALTLREAARLANLDHTTLSRIESGQRPTAPEYLDGLERAYQVLRPVLQLALSGQTSLALKYSQKEPPVPGADTNLTFCARVTPDQKRELALFLGYLRFKAAGYSQAPPKA